MRLLPFSLLFLAFFSGCARSERTVDENSDDVFEDSFSSISLPTTEENEGSDGFPRISAMNERPAETVEEAAMPLAVQSLRKDKDGSATHAVSAEEREGEAILRGGEAPAKEEGAATEPEADEVLHEVSGNATDASSTPVDIESGDESAKTLPVQILELTTASPSEDMVDVTRTDGPPQAMPNPEFPPVMEYELESDEEASTTAATTTETGATTETKTKTETATAEGESGMPPLSTLPSTIFHPHQLPATAAQPTATEREEAKAVAAPSPSSAFAFASSPSFTNPATPDEVLPSRRPTSSSGEVSSIESGSAPTEAPFLHVDPTIFNPSNVEIQLPAEQPSPSTPISSTEEADETELDSFMIPQPTTTTPRATTRQTPSPTPRPTPRTEGSTESGERKTSSQMKDDEEQPFEMGRGFLSVERSGEERIPAGGSSTARPPASTTTIAVAFKAPFTLRITSIDYLPEFRDLDSGKFRKLRDQIVPPLREIFNSALDDFIAVEIVSLEKGSVIVHGMVYTRNSIRDLDEAATRFEQTLSDGHQMQLAGNTVDPRSITINGVSSRVFLEKSQSSYSSDSSLSFILAGVVALGVTIIIVVAFVLIALNNRHNAGTIKLKEGELSLSESGRVFPSHHVNLMSFGQQGAALPLPPHAPLSPDSHDGGSIRMHSLNNHYLPRT